jgi:Type II secretion system (T2SS), protein M subtype b
MNLQPRDRRALAYLGVSVLSGAIYYFWPANSGPAVVAASANSATLAEKRLNQLRETAATIPAREQILKNAGEALAQREKGLIVADTAAQAQAQLIQIVRGLGRAENPPVEIRATDTLVIAPFGDAYGEAAVGLQIECRIDQLVNMLAGIAARPELISIDNLRINSTSSKEKTVQVHLTVSGIVPRKLVPEKHS